MIRLIIFFWNSLNILLNRTMNKFLIKCTLFIKIILPKIIWYGYKIWLLVIIETFYKQPFVLNLFISTKIKEVAECFIDTQKYYNLLPFNNLFTDV